MDCRSVPTVWCDRLRFDYLASYGLPQCSDCPVWYRELVFSFSGSDARCPFGFPLVLTTWSLIDRRSVPTVTPRIQQFASLGRMLVAHLGPSRVDQFDSYGLP